MTNNVSEFPVEQDRAPEVISATRPLLWSIQREFWENRAIYIVPMVVACVAMFGLAVHTMRLPKKMRTLAALSPEAQTNALVQPYSIAAAVILFSGVIFALFYCLDALYGERRDRSILFWKSLPVSDATTVLSKAAIPIVVQPFVAMVIAFSAQILLFIFNNLSLIVRGISPGLLWERVPFIQMPLTMIYGVAVHGLWLAPLYAWLLLISAWSKRAPFLWAVLPFFSIVVVERLAYGKSYLVLFLTYRVIGAMPIAFDIPQKNVPIVHLSQLTPLRFLVSPGLWSGLIFAALCLLLAMRLRRNREPI